MADSVTGYCYRCESEREILLTVAWQDNTCRRCGSSEVTIEQEA
jgi:hypothetical protein